MVDVTKPLRDGAYIVIGVNERNAEASGGSLYNTLLYIDQKGRIMGRHRKLVPTVAERLLYGSDFYISHLRGRCVAVGDSFHWFYAEDMNLAERHTTLRPVLVGLESLRSLRLAARRLKLSDRQIEDIFFSNAAQLFPLT